MKRSLLALAVAALGFSSITATVRPVAAQSANSIKQINAECNAIQDAIMAFHPVHLALLNSKWKVLSTGDYTVAERTHTSVTFVDAWKQGNNYAWIHAHSFDASGNQRATQLCFRQSDGTLERARQATTLSGLGAASAQVAYFSSSGKVLSKTSLFVVNDPAIAKRVSALPYYSQLP
jgi:hypothetical protein